MTTPFKQGSEFGINAITANNQLSPDITALGDGRWLAVWNDPETVGPLGTRYGIRAQILNADGTAAGASSMLIAPAGPFPTDFAFSPSVAGLQSGGFAASWIEFSEANGPTGIYVYGRQYASTNPPAAGTGETLTSPPENLSAATPDVAQLAGGNLVYVWSEGYRGPGSDFSNSIFVTVTAADGTDIVSHVKVETAGGDQQQPSVAALSTGGFVVTWQDDNSDGSGSTVQFQRFDAGGVPQGGNTLVPAQTAGNQTAPVVAGLADGRFVIVFADASQQYVGDSAGTAVVARVFNADGSALQDFLVNTLSAGDQNAPTITALADGRFFVAWVDGSGNEGPGGTGTAIRGQLFAFNGTSYVPDGSEILVNTYTSGDQLAPAVATLADGRIVVTWQTASGVLDNSGTGISSQILDPRESGQSWTAASIGPSQYYGTIYGDVLYGGSAGTTIAGSAGDDVLVGGAGDDVLDGGDGSDTLIGYGGVNTLSGGDGNDVLWFHQGDTFNGGTGFDYLIAQSQEALSIAIAGSDVEAVIGTNANDHIDATGVPTPVFLWGLGGNDTLTQGGNGGYLFGGDGDDILTGSVGADFVLGNAGADQIDGGDGNDVLYIDQFDAVDGGGGFDYAIADQQSALVLSLANTNVEAVIGTGTADDIDATGVSTATYLWGLGGDDTLIQGSGGGYLFGDDGDDVLVGGTGADNILGGAGADDLTGGDGGDVLYIDQFDTYNGGAGGDYAIVNDASTGDYTWNLAGRGVEVFIGNAGNDAINATGVNASMALYGGAGNDLITGANGSSLMFGMDGDDVLVAGAGGAIMLGGDGADSFVGSAVDDTIYIDSFDTSVNGASGTDTVIVDGNSAAGVNVQLADASVEVFIGSNFADTADASGAASGVAIYGNGGNDVLRGGAGVDAIFGGEGDDTLDGGGGSDTLQGGAGDDAIDGGNGNDTVLFTGARAEYDITEHGDGTLTVAHARGTLVDGNDTVRSTELFLFADGIRTFAELNANAAPVIETTTLRVAENQLQAGLVLAADTDPSDTLAYAIVLPGVGNGAGADGAQFAIDPATGALSFLAEPDFEAPADAGDDNIYDVTVAVSDGRGGTAVRTVEVAVTDASDAAPTAILLDPAAVSENVAASTVVGSLVAVDPDLGDTITFSLIDSVGGRFILGGALGTQVLAGATPLDFETAASHQIVVRATDSAGFTFDETITISVDDLNEAPAALNLALGAFEDQALNIPATAGLLAGAFAVDQDANAVLHLSMLNGVPVVFDQNGLTQITLASGASVTVGSDGSFSYNQNGVYDDLAAGQTLSGVDALSFRVADQGGLESNLGSVSFNVVGVNDAPVVTTTALSAMENQTEVGSVLAGDPDTLDTLAYAIVLPNGSNDAGADGGLFAINAGTGALRFLAAPNFEAPADTGADNFHVVTVAVSDGQGGTTLQTIEVTVSNAGEAPSAIALDTAIVAENSAAGTVIGTLAAVDPDVGDAITFSLIDSAGSRFILGGALGNELLADATLLNFESESSHQITVRATDDSGLSYDQMIVISVGPVNETPLAGTGAANATEDQGLTVQAASGLLAGALASDPDFGNVLHLIELDGAPAVFDGNGHAMITLASGAVVTVSSDGSYVYDQQSAYNALAAGQSLAGVDQFTFRVTDQFGLTSNLGAASFNIVGVNDSPASLQASPAAVDEQAASGTVVATLTATDPDTSDTLTFSLVDDAGGRFALQGSDIVVADGSLLSFAAAASHEVTVVVTDAGGLTRALTVTVGVNNVDEAPTAISLSATSVAENSAAGTIIATLTGSDTEGGTLSFALANDPSGFFEIVGDQLQVADGAVIDFEQLTQHQIAIEATDTSGLSYTENFTIAVLDVTEPPAANAMPIGGAMPKGTNAGQTIDAIVRVVDQSESGSSDDVINSFSGDETLDELAGHAAFRSEARLETPTGDVGADAFIQDWILGPTNIDQLTDFAMAADQVWLEDGIVPGLGVEPGELSASAFVVELSAEAAKPISANDYVTGCLYSDQDGPGTPSAQVKITQLDSEFTVNDADLEVVYSETPPY